MKATTCLLLLSAIFSFVATRGLTTSMERSRSLEFGGNRRGPEDNVHNSEIDRSQDNESKSSVECPSSGHHFFPHPHYCSQFIECQNGVYSIVNCPPGLHFTPSAGFCDIPDNCLDFPPQPTTIAKPEDGGPIGKCPPTNGEFVDFLTDSVDGSAYYVCNWGQPIKMTCPSGLRFNPTLNVCG